MKEWLSVGIRKKLTVLVLGTVITFVRDWLGLSIEELYGLLGFGGLYLVGEGVADHGKEAAKIARDADDNK